MHIRILNLKINSLRTFAKGRHIGGHESVTKIRSEDLTAKCKGLKNLYPHQEITSLYPHKGMYLPPTENNKMNDFKKSLTKNRIQNN